LIMSGPTWTTEWYYNREADLIPGLLRSPVFRDALEPGWTNERDAHSQVTLMVLSRYGHPNRNFEIVALVLVEEPPDHHERLYRRVGLFYAVMKSRSDPLRNPTGAWKGFQNRTLKII
jgi:hypothetical protein